MDEKKTNIAKVGNADLPDAQNEGASKSRENNKIRIPSSEDDLFLLDMLYPEAQHVFKATSALNPSSDNVMVALDTNALLLPYILGKGDLSELESVYLKIAEAKRLFLPGRVAREFIKNRDRKLADMVQAIDDRISKMSSWDARISSLLLGGFAEGEALAKAGDDLGQATKAYLERLRSLSTHMKSWRGNDPVTALYARLFDGGQTAEPNQTPDQITQYLYYGLRNKIPPGYKDAGKDDCGIGDVVIWLSLLHLGETQKKDLIFVTGEEKADWFVRSGSRPLYPRPELVDAYRRASNGRSLRLSSLHELLKDMSAPAKLVSEVEDAERTANDAAQAASSNMIRASARSRHTTLQAGQVHFDYSTNDGMYRINKDGYGFDLQFSKGSNVSIHLYKRGNARRIARVKNVQIGVPASIDQYETSSSSYAIGVNEGFIIENEAGALLAGRIIGILDDTRGSSRDEIAFTYLINEQGGRIVMP